MASSVSATTYTGVRTFDGATVDLSITTDGNTGALVTSDITSWNIDITDPAGSVDLTPGNSAVAEFGTDLTRQFVGPSRPRRRSLPRLL